MLALVALHFFATVLWIILKLFSQEISELSEIRNISDLELQEADVNVFFPT